jgi:hypothetical protein
VSHWEDALLARLEQLPVELQKVSTELSVGLQQYANGNRLRGARAVVVGAAGRPLLWAGPGRLVGWSVHAVGGAVTVVLHDSRDASGDTLAAIELAAGASQSFWAGPGGVSFGEGLYATISGAGAVEGALWLGAVD